VEDATYNDTYNATRAATRAATYDAMVDATFDATDDAVDAATQTATQTATHAATVAATEGDTYAATRAARDAAVDEATRDATFAATFDVTRDAKEHATHDRNDYTRWYLPGQCPAACRDLAGHAGLQCSAQMWKLWQGGNQWGQFDSLLSFFRHVAQLPLDYSKWAPWETLAIHSGPRIMHEHFCMISDRPERIMVDNNHEPHCEDGPFCRWRDGTSLYAIHGVRMPAWVVEFPEAVTVDHIDAEPNAEVRRIMMERFGFGRYFMESKSTLIDFDASPVVDGGAPRMLVEDSRKEKWLVGTDGGTNRVYTMSVPQSATTCAEAHRLISGFNESNIIAEG
jgi:hypothetical protein